MKKVLVSTNVILLLALVSILCYNQSCKEDKSNTAAATTTINGNRGLSDDECATCYPNACDTPFMGLNAKLAADMVYNYKAHQWNSITGGAMTDSRSVWLSLQTLKRFIHEIEGKVCTTCNNTPLNTLGVRIYYAAYPSGADWSEYGTALNGVDEQSSATRHTVVMVPTYYNGTYDIDFDPNYIGANCVPLTMCQVYDSLKSVAGGTLTVLTSGDVNMQNHGTMDPPLTVPTFAKVVDSTCNGTPDNTDNGSAVIPRREEPRTR